MFILEGETETERPSILIQSYARAERGKIRWRERIKRKEEETRIEEEEEGRNGIRISLVRLLFGRVAFIRCASALWDTVPRYIMVKLLPVEASIGAQLLVPREIIEIMGPG